MKKILLAGLAAATLLASGAAAQRAPADGQSRVVVFVNATSEPVFWLYGSRAEARSWEGDLLAGRTLSAGQSVSVDLWDGTDACVFDIRVVWEHLREEIRWGVNICEEEAIILAPPGRAPMNGDPKGRERI